MALKVTKTDAAIDILALLYVCVRMNIKYGKKKARMNIIIKVRSHLAFKPVSIWIESGLDCSQCMRIDYNLDLRCIKVVTLL